MDTPSCTVGLKPTMMRSEKSRHEIIKSAAQFSPLILKKKQNLLLGLRIFKISINNPDTGIRKLRNPITKMTSTQIEIEIQIDSSTQIDQKSLGPTDPITVNKLSITSTLRQNSPTLKTRETFHRASTYLHPPQFNFLTI